jgi:hypothetical protein
MDVHYVIITVPEKFDFTFDGYLLQYYNFESQAIKSNIERANCISVYFMIEVGIPAFTNDKKYCHDELYCVLY